MRWHGPWKVQEHFGKAFARKVSGSFYTTLLTFSGTMLRRENARALPWEKCKALPGPPRKCPRVGRSDAACPTRPRKLAGLFEHDRVHPQTANAYTTLPHAHSAPFTQNSAPLSHAHSGQLRSLRPIMSRSLRSVALPPPRYLTLTPVRSVTSSPLPHAHSDPARGRRPLMQQSPPPPPFPPLESCRPGARLAGPGGRPGAAKAGGNRKISQSRGE